MSFYEEKIAPHLVSFLCAAKPIRRQREKVVPLAQGRVLEVGFGSGLNLPHYSATEVAHLFALEPSASMRKKAAPLVETMPFPVEFLDLPGEQIPLQDNSVDTIVVTYTLCTIPGVDAALEGMRRVMKPDGKLIFCEHGKAPDKRVLRFQNRLNPLWKPFAGGCNLNRDIPALLTAAGFRVEALEQMYLPKTPRFVSYNYWGVAGLA